MFESLELEFALLMLAACAAAWWFLKARQGKNVVRHILRLSTEIADVADTISADLKRLASDRGYEGFFVRCGEVSERARTALDHGAALRRLDPVLLSETALHLHEDHRRIVELRLELDRVLSDLREAHDRNDSRMFKVRIDRRSGWPSSGLQARPSTYS